MRSNTMLSFESVVVCLILLYLVDQLNSTGIQECSNGCLRCSSNGICLLCDNTQYYIRDGYKCVQNYIANCVGSIDGSSCYQCQTDYYWNSAQLKCLPVGVLRKNCRYYNSNGMCSSCNTTNYYVDQSSGNCAVLTSSVLNCLVHSANGICSQCLKYYYLSNDMTNCIAVKQVPNCLLYSKELSCSTCQEGFNLQRNKYLMDLKVDYNFLLSFYTEMIASVQFNTTVASNATNVCVPKIANCATETPYNNCTACAPGYYNAKGQCQLSPAQSIQNCVLYADSMTCLTCTPGYFLESNACKATNAIKNCLLYDNTRNNVCASCNSDYFVKNGNCVLRSNVIRNCAVYNPAMDSCQQCDSSFWISPNGGACLFNVQFCKVPLFLEDSLGNFQAACSQCINQFYVSTLITNGVLSTSCVLPNQLIEGCLAYKQADSCMECAQGYYLANFNCRKHDALITSMIDCLNYSTVQPNQCVTCSSQRYLYKLLNYCNSVANQVANCQVYDVNSNCVLCNAGYYIATDSNFNVICQQTNIQNCVLTSPTSNTCLMCDSQTATMPNNKAQSNQCVSIPMEFTANCQNFVVDILNDVANCKSCFAPFYPLLMDSIYFQYCYPFSEFTLLGSGITSSQITAMGSCLSFDLASASCLMCDAASIAPMISAKSPGVCVINCNWGDEVILTFSFNGIYPNSFFQCSQVSLIHMSGDSSTNCKRADYDVSMVPTKSDESGIKQYCAECLANFIPVVYSYNSNFYTHYDYLPMQSFNNRISATSYFSPYIKRPLFQNCKSWTSTFMTNNNIPFDSAGMMDSALNPLSSYNTNSIYFVLNWASFANCVILIGELQSSGSYLYGCASCAFQYTGTVISSKLGTNFIYNCIQMTQCDTSIYYAGVGSHDLNAQMYMFVSCHVCLDKSMIVTITSIKPWTFPVDVTQTLSSSFSQTGNYAANSCYPPGMISANQAFFPANCQIQQVIPSMPFQSYTSTLSISPNPACVACAPKYYPTISSINLPNEVYRYIISCKPIANCLSSATFNVCDLCQSGYVLMANLTAVGNSNGYPCVANSIKGCQIGYLNGICIQCLSSYTLNIYGFCDTLIMPKCLSFGNLTPLSSAFAYLTTNPFPQGCLNCQIGSYSVRLPFKVTFCVQSNSDSSTTITPNFFIMNCLYYQFSITRSLMCVTCAAGYSPNTSQDYCFKLNSIPNCMIYSSISTPSSLVCNQCFNLFYLQNNLCFPGQIKSCLVYIDRLNCQTCLAGMVATQVNYSNFIECFDVSSSLRNCMEYDLNLAFFGYLKCIKCSSTNYLVTLGVPISTCSQFSEIDNCLQYDLRASFLQTTFFCVLCSGAYYVQSINFPSVCIRRLNFPIVNCFSYKTDVDVCRSCITGFYLSKNNLVCVQNPNGIQGCRTYTNVTTCEQCDGVSNYYALNGACIILPASSVVVQCYAYDSKSLCTMCNPGYQLSANTCNLVTIQNCLIVGLGNICLTCAAGYTLIDSACYIVSIENCQVYISTISCQQCVQGYYLNSGRCFQPQVISNCISYLSQNQCSMCKYQQILSIDFQSCLALNSTQIASRNANCYQYSMLSTCIYCQFGYYFNADSASCTQCATSPAASCAICDFLDPSVCLICSSGYFMISNSTCLKNIVIQTIYAVSDNPSLDIYSSSTVLNNLLIVFFVYGLS